MSPEKARIPIVPAALGPHTLALIAALVVVAAEATSSMLALSSSQARALTGESTAMIVAETVRLAQSPASLRLEPASQRYLRLRSGCLSPAHPPRSPG
jgi:hypothetical protein